MIQKGFKYLGYILLLLGVGIALLLLADSVHQYPTPLPPERLLLRAPSRQYLPLQQSASLQQLRERYGKNKILPKGYEEQALIALSHYPQLEEVPIRFELTETLIPLASRPDVWSVLLPWKPREYCIIISTKSIEMLEPILLHNLSYNAQIGVLGHELAHTVYYLDKHSMEHAGIAFRYLFEDYRKEFERATDQRTIAHGLGYQLLAWAKEVKASFKGDETQSTMENTYYSPQEIEEAMERLPLYQP